MHDSSKIMTEQELGGFLESYGQRELESSDETHPWELDDLYFLYKRDIPSQ